MRLTELIDDEGGFRKSNPDHSLTKVDTLEKADCIFYLCPLCFQKNGGAKGTHSFLTPNENMPEGRISGKNRWKMTGNTLEDLTVEPSILDVSPGGCGAHFFIRNGEIIMS